MRDYGKVYSTFWSSDTTGGLSDDGKLLALYLMTCHHSTIAGVFRLPDGYVSEDLRWSQQRVAKGFDELFAKGFATRCKATKWVWVTKHLEWNKPENPNQRKSAAKLALSIPVECGWRLDFMRVCGEVLALEPPSDANPSETVPKPLLNQEQKQKQKQEQEQEQKTPSGLRGEVPSPRPAKKCPRTFDVTDELRGWAATNAPGIDVDRETEKLRDHTFATARSDWPGTWRNWMRKAAEQRVPPASAARGKHAGFAGKDYREGVEADGSFA